VAQYEVVAGGGEEEEGGQEVAYSDAVIRGWCKVEVDREAGRGGDDCR